MSKTPNFQHIAQLYPSASQTDVEYLITYAKSVPVTTKPAPEFLALLKKVATPQSKIIKALGLEKSQGNFSKWINGKSPSPHCAKAVLEYLHSHPSDLPSDFLPSVDSKCDSEKQARRFIIFVAEGNWSIVINIVKELLGHAIVLPFPFPENVKDGLKVYGANNISSQQLPTSGLLQFLANHIDPIKEEILELTDSRCKLQIIDNNSKLIRKAICLLRLYVEVGEKLLLPLSSVPVNPPAIVESTTSVNSKPLESSQRDKDGFYPTQKQVGQIILEKIENIKSQRNLDSFDFLIVVPNRVTLHEQTKQRLMEIFPGLPVDKYCVKASTSKEGKDIKVLFLEKVTKNPNTLHLIIHDECHWGIKKGGQIDSYLAEFQSRPNVVFLMISATLENCLVPGNCIPPECLIDWTSIVKESGYRGLEYLYKNSKDENPPQWNQNAMYPAQLPDYTGEMVELLKFNKMKTLWLSLLDSYIKALYGLNTEPASIEAVRKVLQGGLLLVRVTNIYEAKAMCFVLRKIQRDHFKGKFEVLLDSMMDSLSLSQFQCYRNQVAEQAKLKQGDKLKGIPYEALKKVPCFLFVVEKARMGSTLPETFSTFDLRLRYSSDASTMYSSFLQDCGRSFGYGVRPMLLMSKMGYEMGKKIASGESIWEVFLPGPQTCRVKQNEDDGEEIEDDEDDQDELTILRQIFASKLNMFEGVSFEQRFLLKAKPQLGKTGAYMYVLSKLKENLNVNQSGQCSESELLELDRLNSKWYSLPTNDLNQLFTTNEGIEEYKGYHLLCAKVGNTIPTTITAGIVKQILEEEELEEGTEKWELADFGSGPNAPIFAELKNDERIAVTNYDHVANTENHVIAANCASLERKDHFHIITCVNALMGADYYEILHRVQENLKRSGIFILIEAIRYLPDATALESSIQSLGFEKQMGYLKTISPIQLSGFYCGIFRKLKKKKESIQFPSRQESVDSQIDDSNAKNNLPVSDSNGSIPAPQFPVAQQKHSDCAYHAVINGVESLGLDSGPLQQIEALQGDNLTSETIEQCLKGFPHAGLYIIDSLSQFLTDSLAQTIPLEEIAAHLNSDQNVCLIINDIEATDNTRRIGHWVAVTLRASTYDVEIRDSNYENNWRKHSAYKACIEILVLALLNK